MVNTARANPIAGRRCGRVRPQSLSVTEPRSEQLGERLDFKLLSAEEELWVEVKSATLRSGPSAVAFPDAPSVRARRHLKTLVEIVQAGHRAALLFVLAREGAERVSPAAEVDPLYAEALRESAEAGVELAALCVSFTDSELLPVRLGRVCL